MKRYRIGGLAPGLRAALAAPESAQRVNEFPVGQLTTEPVA